MQGLFVFVEACAVAIGVIVVSASSYAIWRVDAIEPQRDEDRATMK
jgi:hypothetical protein